MNKNIHTWYKVIGVLLLVSLIVSVLPGCSGTSTAPVPNSSEKNLKLGLYLCYTGALAAHASGVSDGMRDKMLWTNKQGGLEYKDPKTGKTEKVNLDVIWEDTAYDAAKGAAIYKRFKANGVQMIAGYGSTPGEVMAPTASRDKIPVFCIYGYCSPAGYDPKPQYYMAALSSVTADYMWGANWFVDNWKGDRPPKLGLLCMDVPSWRTVDGPKGAPARVAALGAEWVGMRWAPASTTDLSVELKDLVIDKKADYLAIFAAAHVATVALTGMSNLGIDLAKTSVMFSGCTLDESICKLSPKETENAYVETFVALPTDDVPGVKTAKEIAAWRGRGEGRFTRNYVEGIGCSYLVEAVIREALQKVGYDALTPTDIRDAFANMKDVQVDGMMPSIGRGTPDFPSVFLWQRPSRIKSSQFTAAGDWSKTTPIKDW